MEFDKGMMTYFVDYGEKIWIPVFAWLVKHPAGDVLVDTGACRADIAPYWRGRAEDIQTVEEGLASFGKKPEDIRHLILTHLHFDHALNACLFHNATVYVQKTEWEYQNHPHPLSGRSYDPAFTRGMKVVQLDGEAEIVPGVRVFPVPGHTPGAQAVEIDTERGRAVISGFCCTEEVFRRKNTIPGIHTDAFAAYDSVQKIRQRADIIIPQHEPSLENVRQIP